MKIAVWYHCRLFGGEPPIDPDYSITLMAEQMKTLRTAGLEQAATEILICVNGDTQNRIVARQLAPAKSTFIDHGRDALGLLRTVNCLRSWCQCHPDWIVCFWHIKGVTHPWDTLNTLWRQCMEKWVIINWRKCVADVGSNFETVGAHWLTPEQYHGIVKVPFWGGQFFWARASFLAELPALPDNPTRREEWFLSENWIGMGRRPRVRDYAPHWPGLQTCHS